MVNNLGLLYADQDKMAEAEKMLLRALKEYKKALSADLLKTLIIVNNLCIVKKRQT